MNEYLARVKELASKRFFLLSYILVFYSCFAFVATHVTIGVDDAVMGVYFSKLFFGQGRFTGALITNLLGMTQLTPVIPDILYGSLMLLACIGYLHLFEISLGYQLDTMKCGIFTALFISYPLVAEIYVFNMMPLAIGSGYLLTSLALIHAAQWVQRRNARSFILSILLMISAISAYESFAVVFICCFLCMLLMKVSVNKVDIKSLSKECFAYMMVLAFAIALEYAVTKGVVVIFGIEENSYPDFEVIWGKRGFIQSLYLSLMSVGRLVIGSAHYLPIRIYVLSAILGSVLSIVWWRRAKKAVMILLFLCLILSTWLLDLLQGTFVYRASQTFSLFISFVGLFMLLSLESLGFAQGWKNAVVALCLLVILWQAVDLNRWFTLDYRRFEEEKRVLLSVSDKLHEEHDLSKPVVFVGEYKLSKDIRKSYEFSTEESKMFAEIIRRLGIPSLTAKRMEQDSGIRYRFVQTAVSPSIGWYTRALQNELGSNGALLEYYRYLGIDDLIQGDFEMYMDAHFKARDESFWPENTYIADAGIYTIVDFSRYSLQNAK